MALRRIAIVGSGPSGFYTAHRLLQQSARRAASAAPGSAPGSAPAVAVDIFERLPVPFGLVRYGVAPDHPTVRACTATFAAAAAAARFRFFGNCPVGNDPRLPLRALLRGYDAVVLATGAPRDRLLPGVPGAGADRRLPGVWPASRVVGWYNGLPAASAGPHAREIAALLPHARDIVIVGNGNVALDLARILLASPAALARTDMPAGPAAVLAHPTRPAALRSVRLVGRRGPAQAAFAIKELRELVSMAGGLSGAGFPVRLDIDPAAIPDEEAQAGLARPTRRMMALLTKAAGRSAGAGAGAAVEDGTSQPVTCSLDFFNEPAYLSAGPTGQVASATFTRTAFAPGADPLSKQARVEPVPAACGTEKHKTRTVPADIVISAIGYEAEPMPGLEHLFAAGASRLPGDGCGRLPLPADAGPGVGRLYAAGWLATGATGAIAQTMAAAFELADTVLADLGRAGADGDVTGRPGWDGLEAGADGMRPVSWQQWERIDQVERERGGEMKEREKITSVEEMMDVAE